MTLRYKLRTLLILLALLPPLIGVVWMKYAAWRAEYQAALERRKELEERQRLAVQRALAALRTRLMSVSTPYAAPKFRQPPGNSDYQFPPRPPFRISDEESAARGPYEAGGIE